MASSGTLAAGTTSYSSTLTAGTADTVTFSDRYGYVTVANTGSAPLYVRTDGSAVGVGAADSYVIQAGETQLFANALPLWYQSRKVITKGSNEFGGGNTIDSPTNPGEIQSQASPAGQEANPGTIVSLISNDAVAYTVAAAG